jgi:hypothetical protein
MTSPWPPVGPPAGPPAGRPAGPPAPEPTLAAKFCTNWSEYGLDAIWEMVRGEDGRINGQQVQAWNRMLTLCNHQADRLLKAAARLAERWPPQRSQAAAAFVEYVSRMGNSMQEAATAAGRNMTALEHLSNGLGTARAEVATLLAQRYQYQQREAQRDEYLRTHRASAGKVGFVPITVPEALNVPSNWCADLDQRARQIMQGTETLAAEAGGHMTVPPAYAPRVDIHVATDKNGLEAGRRLAGGSIGVADAPHRSFDPPPAIAAAQHGLPNIPEVGEPVLDGTPAMPGGTLVSPSTAGGRGGSSVGVLPDSAVGVVPGSAVGVPLVLPPRGIVGGPTKAPGHAQPGNPHAGGARAPSAASQAMPMMAPPIAARPGQAHGQATGRAGFGPGGSVIGGGQRGRQFDDPHGLWAIRHGVPPVLEPDPEPQHHDPGPGVIGLNH